MIAYMQPIPTAPVELAGDAVREVGPHNHFFAAEHTQSRYKTAVYAPFLSDWQNDEPRQEAGSIQTPDRANKIWKAILAEFEPPPMDDTIREELAEFVERRKREGGTKNDF